SPAATLVPYTTLFRSHRRRPRLPTTDPAISMIVDPMSRDMHDTSREPTEKVPSRDTVSTMSRLRTRVPPAGFEPAAFCSGGRRRSEEHTSELQSRENL